MKINYKTPPEGSINALNKGMDSILIPSTQNFSKTIGGGPNNNYPHDIYFGNAKEIAAGKGLEALTLTGWRYQLGVIGNANHSAEVNVSADGSHEFSEINTGPFAEGTINLIAKLEADPSKEAYEISAIRIPSIFVFAIWLKGASDVIIPLPPCPAQLQGGQSYTPTEFFKIIKPLAEDALANSIYK